MQEIFIFISIAFGGVAAYFFAKLSAKEKECELLQKQMKDSKEESEKLHEQMKIQFENAANKIINEEGKKMAEINEQKIGVILTPLKEKLGEFQKKVEDAYSNETREKASLLEAIKHINDTNKQMMLSADNLTRALKGNFKKQGDWGELQLETLLEKADLVKGVHYVAQENYKTEDNKNLRPDFVINLPENKHFIIDSKVSLNAYEEYFNSEDKLVKEQKLKEHISNIRKHIKELSAKKYNELYGINSPDFVFMFVPVEPALFISLQSDTSLFDDAIKNNVMLVTHSTLLIALRTVAYIWKIESQNKYVKEIAEIGGKLYDKFAGFVDNMVKVGKEIDSAKNTYSSAMSQLTKKNSNGTERADTILGSIENLKKHGANASKSIDQRLLDRLDL
jgi:DNA recombination protein RmuC